jgi:molecular chaperone GrpE
MSGEPTDHDRPAAAPVREDGGEGDSSVIPVEVEAPDPSPAAAATGSAPSIAPPPPAVTVEVSATAALEAKVIALEEGKKVNYDKYLRAVADLENSRKRQRRELDDAKVEARGKVLKEMLPVVDNLERAIEHAAKQAGDDATQKPMIEGIQLVLRQFTTAFERLDVTNIDAMGQPFDPNLHEAISQAESDQPAGTVVQVLQRGYKSGDRLLRPVLVVVAKAKADA